ncbi:hypothetical protein [Sphingomonas sp. ERG5]|uniref:hypothetical protein n=1 Tax=Sphingomonas sp. ERG5 TaxID=1381597 RepID=UPI00054B9F17|nr:hypothetical protein [Sphingomonas sp. ERG5]
MKALAAASWISLVIDLAPRLPGEGDNLRIVTNRPPRPGYFSAVAALICATGASEIDNVPM